MIVIYSNKRVDGLDGRYINPSWFSRIVNDATIIYTDSDTIKEAYANTDAEIRPITKKATRKKRAK